MTDVGRKVQDDQGVPKQPGENTQESGSGRRDSRTAGKDRDYDESGTSSNQGHGHPRREGGSPAE